MKIIAGLGNPGSQYKSTRHNAGFLAVEHLAGLWGLNWKAETRHRAQTAKGMLAEESILLVKPQTYMNLSGEAVQSLLHYHKLTPSDLIVIHDDVDLPLGLLRLKKGGGSGGHHGLDSLFQQLDTRDFLRLRIGVGQSEWFQNGETHKTYADAAGYVLGNFQEAEKKELILVFEYLKAALDTIMSAGLVVALNRVNSQTI